MAMPQCCYLAKGAKRQSHTTNTIKFDRIPFDPCNPIKRLDLCPFDQKNLTYLQPPEKSLQETLPKIINNTLKEVVNPGVATPSIQSFSSSNNSPKNTFIINGVPDLGYSEIKQTEDDGIALDKKFRHINEDSANIISAWRLGKKRAITQNASGSQGSSPSGSQGVPCRPLLVTCNPWFLRKYLAKNYKLQDSEHRICFKKYLTSSERSVEKNYLQRYKSYYKVVNTKGNSFTSENWTYSTIAWNSCRWYCLTESLQYSLTVNFYVVWIDDNLYISN